MADETKTQIPKPTRQRGPMGRIGGTRRGEKAKDFKGTMRQLLGYIGQHKIAVFSGVAFAVCSVIFNIVGPKVLGQVTTKLFEGLVAKVNGTGDVDFDWIAKTLGFLLCLYLASSACSLIQGWLMTGVTQKICYRMRKEIAAKIAVVPMSYFNGHSKGDVLSRITNDVDTLGQPQPERHAAHHVGDADCRRARHDAFNQPAAHRRHRAHAAGRRDHPDRDDSLLAAVLPRAGSLGAVNGIIEEDFAGQNVIQVFDRAEASVAEFDQKNDRLFISRLALAVPLRPDDAAHEPGGQHGLRGRRRGGRTARAHRQRHPGDIQSFIQYVRNFTQPVQQLGNVSNTLQSMAAATERVFEFLAAPEEEQAADAPVPEKRPGHVEFEHVQFGYTPDKTIIHDFSCDGRTARPWPSSAPRAPARPRSSSCSSASTTWTAGAARRRHRCARLGPRGVRDQFAMVLQDTWLFNGTIRENIRYGRPDATDAEVEAAAKAARCDHFIHTLAGGYDFVINEEGTNLSQGQRQLVTIARAILADRPALILDEATSNVDTRTEELIQRAMDKLMRGRTSFVIAHRLCTIRNADVILVLRDGDIVEKAPTRSFSPGRLLRRTVQLPVRRGRVKPAANNRNTQKRGRRMNCAPVLFCGPRTASRDLINGLPQGPVDKKWQI